MNIKIKLILITMIMLFSSAFADVFLHETKLSSVISKLPELKDIKCNFKQDKKIPSSDIRLKSSGEFIFEKNSGVTFLTTYPTKSETTYRIKEHNQINLILKALADKNYNVIEKDFKIYFEQTPDKLSLGLKPKDNNKASKFITSIEIIKAGQSKLPITKTIVTAKDGTKTTITFF